MKFKNTLRKGSVRVLVFREARTWYAAGLEFNIVESGDTPQEAMILLFEALQGCVESAKKMKARAGILNQVVDPEYIEKWRNNIDANNRSESVFFAGTVNVPTNHTLVPA